MSDAAASGVDTAPPSTTLQDEQLAELLLTEGDLPQGWVVELVGLDPGEGDDPDGDDPCMGADPLRFIDLERDPAAAVTFSFEGESDAFSFDLIGQLIVEMGADDAAAFVDEMSELVSTCVARLAGHPEEGSMVPIVVPALGNDAVGFESSGPPDDTFESAAGVVAVAVGDRLVVVFGVDEGAAPELLADLATIAAARADGEQTR